MQKYFRSFFGANENFKKILSKLTDLYYAGTSSWIVFVRFLRRIEDTKKDISKLTDL